ncbi:TRAP transporter large permease [uncultured Cohaesibacter sp.]|uniref:TRAP transporter large permease n=1 Tax=uncultured Cohaesibacter sp. TaxID=1002546 RepID=UPI0029C89486|nr:TRAP transporter large permease [uncultured Cohaesibacter sp.]
MTPQLAGILGIVALVVLIFLRIPVGISLIFVGFFGYVGIEGWARAATILGSTPFNIAGGYSLSVVPLFVLMGEVASASGMSSRLFTGARAVFGRMKGALAYATIGANAGFGAVCGSSVASAATMTRICVPEMQDHGYDDRLATGSVAAGGTLGILIPPSLILVIYAVIAQESVSRLFAAGLLPGIVLTVLYMLVVTVLVKIFPSFAPENPALSRSERFRQILGIWEFALLFGASVGGIYAGFFSPTEAAAIGAFLAIVIGFATGGLDYKKLISSILATLRTTAMLFMIILGAYVFSYFVVQARLPDALIEWIQSVGMGPLGLMLTLVLAYVILGCFLEGIGLVLITVPVFLPVVVASGFDPVWFGVIVVIVVEMGLINPPVGMNLFVIQAQLPNTPILAIYTGTLPFLIAPLVLIGILLAFPDLALFLPRLLFG